MICSSAWLFLLLMSLPDSRAILNEEVKIVKYPEQKSRAENSEGSNDDLLPRHISSPLDKCTYRVHHILGNLSNRRSSNEDTSTLDLSGYALHQTLRSAPYDMYITNMRIRLPYHKTGYIKIDKCRYDNFHKLLQTNLLFRDLTITGNIQLFSDNDQVFAKSLTKTQTYIDAHSKTIFNYKFSKPRPIENCNMTLKLKSVGLGFSAIPETYEETEHSRNINIKTTATYVEPNYVSIHAYNCRNIGNVNVYKKTDEEDVDHDLESEMEQVFIKGTRSLLTNYMEKKFKDVLRDSLMNKLGFTVSYGR